MRPKAKTGGFIELPQKKDLRFSDIMEYVSRNLLDLVAAPWAPARIVLDIQDDGELKNESEEARPEEQRRAAAGSVFFVPKRITKTF
jgi:hypothetical protein